MLEPRLVLSSFTWTGLDSSSPTLWSDPENWLGGVAPSPGSSVNFLLPDSQMIPDSPATNPFAGEAYPTGTTIDIDSADVGAITIEGSYTFENDPNSSGGALTLDPNSSITIDPTASLTLAGGLQVNFPGSAAVNFSGNAPQLTSLDLVSFLVTFPGTQTGLRPVQIGGNGTITLGSTTTLLNWNIDVGQGSTVQVPPAVIPKIGSLSGSGSRADGGFSG